jgi:hypothetical protein
MNIHIHRGPQMREVARELLGDRWCFRCRARSEFVRILHAPVGLSYYGPSQTIQCDRCGEMDGDLFPGRERGWNEDLE